MPELKNDRAEPQQVQTLVPPKNFEISAEMQSAINDVSAGKSIFITGRAGTGKSTLLTYLRQEVLKDTFIVVAPTGVAAINVGGSTIHKFFGFLPDITFEHIESPEYHPRNQKIMRNLKTLIIDEVSMVRADRLAKFIGACFGFDRIVANRISAINSISFSGQQRDDEGFLFPAGETYFTFKLWRRGNESSMRHIQDISLSEISNAMRDICRVAQGVRPEQLNKEVSRLFGVVKVSAAINGRLDAALRFAIENGKLKRSDNYIQVNE